MASDPLMNFAKNDDYTGFRGEYASNHGWSVGTLTQTQSTSIDVAWSSYRAVAQNKYGSRSYSSALSGNIDFGGLVKDAIQGQTLDKGGSNLEFTGILDSINLVWDMSNNKMRSAKEIMTGMANMGLQGMVLYYSQQAKLLNQINEKTSLTGKMSKDFRDSIMDASIFANRLGISFDEVMNGMVTLIKSSERFKLIGEDTINKISLTSKVFFDSYEEGILAIEEFQKVSRGASDSMGSISEIGHKSLELGLNAKSTVKYMVTNIAKLNQYGFKNGIEGLTRMVQKAQMLRMDLNDSFKIAKDVMDPTRALEMAANLQVIGGAVDAFNDPIRMMWMATNDAEGLQDALIGSAESLVTFNQNSGAFEIVGADLRRARAMAGELGMDFDKLTNLAVQSAQRTSAAADLMLTGLQMSDEDRDFLTNIAQMDSGQMVIETKDKRGNDIKIALDAMTKEQADYLLSQKEEFAKMDDDMDIARQQVTLIENMERDISFLAATARAEIGDWLQDAILGSDFSSVEYEKEIRKFMSESQTELVDELIDSLGGKNKVLVQALKEQQKQGKLKDNSIPQTTNHVHSGTVNHIITTDVAQDEAAKKIINDPYAQFKINGTGKNEDLQYTSGGTGRNTMGNG